VSDDVGICRELTPGCESFGGEVCGCDSQTYPNECTAQRLGVRIRHFRPCLVGIPVPVPVP
jgi:hypothetical protein